MVRERKFDVYHHIYHCADQFGPNIHHNNFGGALGSRMQRGGMLGVERAGSRHCRERLRDQIMSKGIASFVVALVLLCAGLSAPARAKTTVTIYLTDAQGTPVVETDAQGAVIQKMAYRPYGAQVLGSAEHGPGYTGHVNDPDTGLVYMQARYYDPTVGRFLSVDPAPISSGNIFNLNSYDYTNNNPVINADPTGTHTASEGDDVCMGNEECIAGIGFEAAASARAIDSAATKASGLAASSTPESSGSCCGSADQYDQASGQGGRSKHRSE